jgi:ribosomal protein S18 acetylase RimI-like enzyme
MDITIRKAELKDSEGIKNVLTKASLDTFPNEELGITRDDILHDLGVMTAPEVIGMVISDPIKRPGERLLLVADVEGSVVGMSDCKIKDGVGVIVGLFVLPEFQSNGIGSLLHGGTKEFFKDVPQIFLSYESYNTKARGFYRKHGFVETGKTFLKHQVKSGAYMLEIEMVLNQ